MISKTNDNIAFVMSIMDVFGPLVLTALVIYFAGTYVVIPLIRANYLKIVTKRNGGKEPVNAIIDVEILCKRAWAIGGVIMLAGLTTVSQFLAEISIDKSVYAFSVVGLSAGYKGYKELKKFKSVANIYSGDIFYNESTKEYLKVTRILDGLIIGKAARPNIRRGAFKISDYFSGTVKDLGPYGDGEKYHFLTETDHNDYDIDKSIEWRTAVREMLSKRDDIAVVMNGKYVLPDIDFIVCANSCISDERDINVYSDISVAIERITSKLQVKFIKPVPKKE